MQIRVYYNPHTDTGTRTRVNVNAPLDYFDEPGPNNKTTKEYEWMGGISSYREMKTVVQQSVVLFICIIC